MPKKGYNRNSPEVRYQPGTHVPQPPTLDIKPFYPPMSSQQRDERLDILLNKEEKIQNKMNIIEAEAEANSKAREHNKTKIDELQKQQQQQGVLSRLGSYLSYGNTHTLNENIKELQSEQAKHELHDQELRNQIREHVLEQEDIMRSKNDINRMYRDVL